MQLYVDQDHFNDSVLKKFNFAFIRIIFANKSFKKLNHFWFSDEIIIKYEENKTNFLNLNHLSIIKKKINYWLDDIKSSIKHKNTLINQAF